MRIVEPMSKIEKNKEENREHKPKQTRWGG